MTKKLLTQAVTLGLLLGGFQPVALADVSIDVTQPDFSITSSDAQLAGQTGAITINVKEGAGGSYTANVKLLDPTSWEIGQGKGRANKMDILMKVNGGTYKFTNAKFDITGPITNFAYAVHISDGATVTMDSLEINSDTTAYFANNRGNGTTIATNNNATNLTDVYVDKGSTLNLKTLKLNSIINPSSGDAYDDYVSIAHNGIYASGDGSSINIDGETDINTNIPGGITEAYDGDYAVGAAKNDAISAKNGGTVNINQNGTATVKLMGNLDVKNGTMNIVMNNADSVWYGSEVGGINYDKTTHEYGELNSNSKLNLSLANGAQWVPDIMPTSDGGDETSREAFISKITLNPGGIINMHGLNEHTNADKTVNHLTIYNLTTNNGIFRIDATGAKTDDTHRNDTDFITIKAGSGSAYVQPLDASQLEGVSADNPVRFADAAEGITFKALEKTDDMTEGVLYNYTPVVDKNVDSTKFGTNGNDWYLVGLIKETTPTAETSLAAANVDYATATARLEIDSLNKRLGELRDYDSANRGVWVRYKGGEMDSSTNGSFDYKYHFYQVGYDALENAHEETAGRWHKGFAVHYTDGETNYDNGSGENSSRGAALYAGWEGNKGHYADYVLKYSHLRNDFTVTNGTSSVDGEFSNNAISASAEYGRKNALGHDWLIEPQAQLVYTHITGTDYATSNGIKVDMDSVNSLIGRVGFRIGREYNQDQPSARSKWYLKADLLHEFAGDRDVTLNGTDASLTNSVDGGDTWLAWGFGGDIALDKNSYFYCDFERTAGGDINTKWQINGGLRWEF